jgi:hypothetical protein
MVWKLCNFPYVSCFLTTVLLPVPSKARPPPRDGHEKKVVLLLLLLRRSVVTGSNYMSDGYDFASEVHQNTIRAGKYAWKISPANCWNKANCIKGQKRFT